jgi:hypothetical protein
MPASKNGIPDPVWLGAWTGVHATLFAGGGAEDNPIESDSEGTQIAASDVIPEIAIDHQNARTSAGRLRVGHRF